MLSLMAMSLPSKRDFNWPVNVLHISLDAFFTSRSNRVRGYGGLAHLVLSSPQPPQHVPAMKGECGGVI